MSTGTRTGPTVGRRIMAFMALAGVVALVAAVVQVRHRGDDLTPAERAAARRSALAAKTVVPPPPTHRLVDVYVWFAPPEAALAVSVAVDGAPIAAPYTVLGDEATVAKPWHKSLTVARGSTVRVSAFRASRVVLAYAACVITFDTLIIGPATVHNGDVWHAAGCTAVVP